MIRIKIMLLSLTLFAAIGGALAFKAKFAKVNVCYTTTNLNTTCEWQIGEVNFTNLGTRYNIYTTTPNIWNGELVCYTWDEEQPEITTKLPCTFIAVVTTAEF